MLKLEEYIYKRKKEDNLNEFDLEKKNDNTRLCVNYVFEYFNNYLNTTEAEHITVKQQEKLDKYRSQLEHYTPEVREWLVEISNKYGNRLERTMGNWLYEFEFFYLYKDDSDFRSLSYECYSKFKNRLPYLKDDTEMLFLFIKEYHFSESCKQFRFEVPQIEDEIDEWCSSTWSRYKVNLYKFAYDWIMYFFDNEKIWPTSHRIKANNGYSKYEYDYKQSSNLFNIDSLYRRMPKYPYVKSKKQELEILMMYYWLHDMVGDKSDYWQEYLEKVLNR